MGGKSSSSASNSTTNQEDNRLVVGEGAIGVGTDAALFASYTDASRVNVTGADSARIVEANAGLLRGLASEQTDAVKLMSAMGYDTLRSMGGSATNILETAGQNTRLASEHMLDATEGVIDKLLTASGRSSDQAAQLAASAIASYQPAESKAGDALKYGAIAAAAVVALAFLKK
jgi:threonine dehydrogenase-like Zn-dependent dehydrogenase